MIAEVIGFSFKKRMAAEIIATLHAAGFKVVPREPTEKMKQAAFNVMPNDVRCATIWAVMLHAAEDGK